MTKRIGATFFIIIAIVIVGSIFIHRDYHVPEEMRGCYKSKQGQVTTVSEDSLDITGSGLGEVSLRFERTNLWDQIIPTPGLIPELRKNGLLQLTPDDPGKVIKISPAVITFFTSTGERVNFHRSRCAKQIGY